MRTIIQRATLSLMAATVQVSRDSDGDFRIARQGSDSAVIYLSKPNVAHLVDALKADFPASFPKDAVVPVAASVPAPKRRPHGAQEYKGNGKHAWEAVVDGGGNTGRPVSRLRIPGGWLYRPMGSAAVFVPIPNTVGYPI